MKFYQLVCYILEGESLMIFQYKTPNKKKTITYSWYCKTVGLKELSMLSKLSSNVYISRRTPVVVGILSLLFILHPEKLLLKYQVSPMYPYSPTSVLQESWCSLCTRVTRFPNLPLSVTTGRPFWSPPLQPILEPLQSFEMVVHSRVYLQGPHPLNRFCSYILCVPQLFSYVEDNWLPFSCTSRHSGFRVVYYLVQEFENVWTYVEQIFPSGRISLICVLTINFTPECFSLCINRVRKIN